MSTSLRQQLASYWQRIQFLETENERLTRELAEARARARSAVREALEEAVGAAEGTISPDAAACAVFNRVHGMLYRLNAEEPKPREGLVAVRIGPRVYWISTKAASGIEAICAAAGSDKPQLARLDAAEEPKP